MNKRTLAIFLALLLTGCGQYYWEGPGRGVAEFRTDSSACIQEATLKYDVALERLYRGCMKSRGWNRVLTGVPSNQQFRGPEDEESFAAPPDPLSERARIGSDDIACAGPTASRPQHCPR
jgi:hypothetical protein